MNSTNKILKIFYMPLCRIYAKHILKDKPADAFYSLLCRLFFLQRHRYWLHLNKPRSFSEKIWNRMLYNREPLLTLISDKLRVRDYVAQKIGSDYLIPLLWRGENPEDIPFEMLPKKFVIKANHGCGYNIIVQDKTKLNLSETITQLKAWLLENYCLDKFLSIEWAYKNIKPSILIEAFLDDNGKVPLDYKFFCYSGRVEFVQVSFDRFGNASEKLLDRVLRPLDVWNGLTIYGGKVAQPDNYAEMIKLAELLADGFDFIRVDLYSVGNRVYFGELTCYPAGGIARFEPKEYDFIFGEKWIIKNANDRKKKTELNSRPAGI